MEATMVEQTLTVPRMLQQDGTTAENECLTTGEYISCPAMADFTFDGRINRMTAQIQCPLSATGQSDFRQASQEGLCQCDATLQDLSTTGSSPIPLDCECFICPDQANLFGVAFTCSSTITGPCTVFNCAGVCNGDLNFINSETNAPTPTPVEGEGEGGSAGMSASSNLATAALLVLTLLRMFR